ncbi:MAG: 30S ribosomal protein S20 [Candidatus Wallbacteria bacterium]|nr:30S ribosomal protein S20 [Candidatus Wallbacteria bacterium]
MAEAPKPKKQTSAEKRARQNEKRRARNFAIKSSLKTINKKFLDACATGDKVQAEAMLRETAKAFDKAVSKNVIHKNKASRKKARLAKRLQNVSVPAPAKKGSKKS